MVGRLLPTHIQIQITRASISPLTRPTSDIGKDSGWACFRFGQVENAEVWNRSTETKVRKRKYGNRSTEGKEKLSMSSPASLGRLLNKAVSLLLSSHYNSPFVPSYHKRRTKLYPHVLYETYCILSDTSNLDCIVQNPRVTHVEGVLYSPCCMVACIG